MANFKVGDRVKLKNPERVERQYEVIVKNESGEFEIEEIKSFISNRGGVFGSTDLHYLSNPRREMVYMFGDELVLVEKRRSNIISELPLSK